MKPIFLRRHPNSWKSYHRPSAKGTVSPLRPSDGMILLIGRRLKGHSVISLAIQIHLSRRFLLAVDSLGLRRSGSSSQFIDPPQDLPKQVPGHVKTFRIGVCSDRRPASSTSATAQQPSAVPTGFGASPLLQARADTVHFGTSSPLSAMSSHPCRPLRRR